MMRLYVGTVRDGGCKAVYATEGPSAWALDPRLDIWSHSPAGFNWGYGGSGPAQLALALLADAVQHDGLAVLLYQQFKREVVALIPGDTGWIMSREEILLWATEQAGEELAQRVNLDVGTEADG